VCPVPDGVELAFFTELDGDHHAVAHALGAGVVVGPVSDVGEGAAGVGAGFKIDTLFLTVAVEELLECLIDSGAGFGGRVAEFGEEIAVLAGGERAGAVAGHGGDVAKRGIGVRDRRREHGRRLGGRFGRLGGGGRGEDPRREESGKKGARRASGREGMQAKTAFQSTSGGRARGDRMVAGNWGAVFRCRASTP